MSQKLCVKCGVRPRKNRKRTCKACESIREAKSKVKPPKKDGKHVLFVSGDTLVLAQVISQSEARNKKLLIDIYREQGYTIETVYESESLS